MPYCLLSPDGGSLYPDGPPILFPDGWWCPGSDGGRPVVATLNNESDLDAFNHADDLPPLMSGGGDSRMDT